MGFNRAAHLARLVTLEFPAVVVEVRPGFNRAAHLARLVTAADEAVQAATKGLVSIGPRTWRGW